MPASSAASTTAAVPAASVRQPKLLHPMPTRDTLRDPSLRYSISAFLMEIFGDREIQGQAETQPPSFPYQFCGHSLAPPFREALCLHSTRSRLGGYAYVLISHGLSRFSYLRGRYLQDIFRIRFRITLHTHIGWPVLLVRSLSSGASSCMN